MANRPAVRNQALHDQLHAFAERAAGRLAADVESGSEIPFEVAENPGATSVLYRYRPLSARFVRERFGELRGLEGFSAAVLALARLEGSSAYLRVLGTSYVPASGRDRAETVLREFLARLWDEVTAFELEEPRFQRAYAELESVVYENTVVTTVLAPVLGVRLAEERFELGAGIALVRGDVCEAPPEAVWVPGREETQPNTLVVLSVEATPNDPPPLTEARLAFRKLLTTLRLFKPGAATLGQAGWWRLDDGPWQSLPLGFAGRPRAAEYWLEQEDRDELAELYDLVRQRPLRGGPLPWALARFEMGCEQPLAVEGLSDHLLALRALLDGEDTSPAGVSSRLAALCAEPPGRQALASRIEQAFVLQRRLMRGDPDSDRLKATGADAPDRVAHDLENHLRALLRDMVCGYLDTDVKRTADELLRAEAEARPDADPPQPKPARSDRRRKLDPVLESWEEVPDSATAPATDEPPEPEFVVRRKDKTPARKRRSSRKTDAEQRTAPEEQDTQETVAVAGVRELSPDDDVLDWGFDDDPSDYSAAV